MTSIASAVLTSRCAPSSSSSSSSKRETLTKFSMTTKPRQTIAVKSSNAFADDELYVPPGGSIVDASGYEMFSSASGIIRSETQANMVVPRSEAGDPFQMLLRQRIVMLGNRKVPGGWVGETSEESISPENNINTEIPNISEYKNLLILFPPEAPEWEIQMDQGLTD